MPYVKQLDWILTESAKPVPFTALSNLWQERRKRMKSETDEYEEIDELVSSLDVSDFRQDPNRDKI